MNEERKRLVAISGPSCGGKTPLLDAVEQFHKDLEFVRLPVIKSKESRGKAPRPDEAGIWEDPDFFRPQAEIESLSGERYVGAVSHGYPQVLDLQRLAAAEADLVVLEACQEITRQLPSSSYLREMGVVTVFVSPLGADEIAQLRACRVDVIEYVKGLNARRLLRRAAFHRRDIDESFLADAAVRAADAVDELRTAHRFRFVLVSRAGEGSHDWNRGPDGRFLGRPRGEAGATLDTFVQLLRESYSPALETWTAPLV